MNKQGVKDLLEKYSPILQNNPQDILSLRRFHSDLTNRLRYMSNPEEFTMGLVYKSLVEDVLKNFAGDDYVRNEFAKKVIKKLAETMDATSNLKRWVEQLDEFSRVYHNLPKKRIYEDHLTIGDFKIGFASRKDRFLVDEDASFEVYPNIDVNLAIPKNAKKICEWYIKAIRESIEKTRWQGKIEFLCFIEKPYSSVGAMTLLPVLVSELELPGLIYRIGYWDNKTKIAGYEPLGDTGYCIIDDIVLTGNTIIGVNKAMKREYNSTAKAAVVWCDLSKDLDASKKLAKREIELESCLKISDFEEEIKKNGGFVREMRHLLDTSSSRSQKEQEEEASRILKKYS